MANTARPISAAFGSAATSSGLGRWQSWRWSVRTHYQSSRRDQISFSRRACRPRNGGLPTRTAGERSVDLLNDN